ncbi:MAG TPA: hypothetical protein VK528_13385 [Flavobacterium sp.]|nr:hypothetical protein [Flavobacterium sp.]
MIYNKPFHTGAQNTTLYSGVANCTADGLKTMPFAEQQFLMIPNPAKDRFEITLSDASQKIEDSNPI